MGREPGQVGGQPAQIKQFGQRIDAIHDFQPGGVHSHIVSNDGLNADYVREGNMVIVDASKPNPYAPYPYKP